MKLFLDFHGSYAPPQDQYNYQSVPLPAKVQTPEQIALAAVQAVQKVKTKLQQARSQGIPVTLGLPDHAVLACAVLQAVRGVLGYVPYVACSLTEPDKDLDLEEVREAARELL